MAQRSPRSWTRRPERRVVRTTTAASRRNNRTLRRTRTTTTRTLEPSRATARPQSLPRGRCALVESRHPIRPLLPQSSPSRERKAVTTEKFAEIAEKRARNRRRGGLLTRFVFFKDCLSRSLSFVDRVSFLFSRRRAREGDGEGTKRDIPYAQIEEGLSLKWRGRSS